jgi:hypothetical protein
MNDGHNPFAKVVMRIEFFGLKAGLGRIILLGARQCGMAWRGRPRNTRRHPSRLSATL